MNCRMHCIWVQGNLDDARNVHYLNSVVDFICIYKCQNYLYCTIQIYVIYFNDNSIMPSNVLKSDSNKHLG